MILPKQQQKKKNKKNKKKKKKEKNIKTLIIQQNRTILASSKRPEGTRGPHVAQESDLGRALPCRSKGQEEGSYLLAL